MASLKNGILLRLLDDMKTEDNSALIDDDRKLVLLQIRSIIPVLEEGDLWPNRGFFLKVSDSSHTLYVSLPQEQNEMILGNKLKLGQFIYVTKLEKAHPVPLLRGIIPIPGRRQCEGTPVDIISQANLLKLLDASPMDSIVEKGVILEKKISKTPYKRGLSDSESLRKRSIEGLKGGGYRGRSRSLSATKARPIDISKEKCTSVKIPEFEKICNDIIIEEWPKSRPSSIDNDSDAESVISSASSAHISKRRSWNESEILRVKEIFDSSVVKREIKRPPRSRSANVSPVRSARYDSSDDNSSSKPRRVATSTKRPIKTANKFQSTPLSNVKNEQISNPLCSLVYERKGAEIGISWNSLPPNLVKLGKEVIRQRDIAILAATDALQEACAAERLLNSLSTLSEFPLAEGDNLQPYMDKFFDLQDDLARSKLIMQSLTSISPLRTPDIHESCNTNNSIKETISVALERKKNATTWIKSAMALDLSPCSAAALTNTTVSSTNSLKKSSRNTNYKPKGGACIVKKARSSSSSSISSNADVPNLVLATEINDQEQRATTDQWSKGNGLCYGLELSSSLQDECRKLFLSYVEKYLDEVERKSSLMEYDGEMAEMMYKVKRVSDWLDLINKDPSKKNININVNINIEDSEINEAYGRVRNKIYGILLKHVEKTAMAFQRFSASI